MGHVFALSNYISLGGPGSFLESGSYYFSLGAFTVFSYHDFAHFLAFAQRLRDWLSQHISGKRRFFLSPLSGREHTINFSRRLPFVCLHDRLCCSLFYPDRIFQFFRFLSLNCSLSMIWAVFIFHRPIRVLYFQSAYRFPFTDPDHSYLLSPQSILHGSWGDVHLAARSSSLGMI